MSKYHVVIAPKSGEIKVLESWDRENANEVIKDLAVEKYNYEKEAKDMQRMFGNFEKCGGVLFRNCDINKGVRGHEKDRIKNCAANCPRQDLPYDVYLRAITEDTIIIINADVGEVWRNDPTYKMMNMPPSPFQGAPHTGEAADGK